MDNILIVSSSRKGMDFFTEVLSQNSYGDIVTAKNGVITISKPMNRTIFWSALKIANATYNKMCQLKRENNKLLQKIEDIRMIDRAKCILIQYLNMTESEAHRYIEKQAMDMRSTKRSIAEGILRTYEN